jgi:hypothetical protein
MAADPIDLPSDAWPEQSGDHQRSGECREKPVARNPKVVRDRIGENGRQIVARSPRQRLGRAKR